MKVQYVGDHERFFVGTGLFRPGDTAEVAEEKAKELLNTGYFKKIELKTKKEGDQ